MSSYEYSVMIRDHVDAAGGDFSPGAIIQFIANPTYLGWSEYVNEVGECFFTLSQHAAEALRLAHYKFSSGGIISHRPHLEVRRNGVKVWSGWLGEIDESETDVILYGYSYLSGFYDLLTDFVDKQIGVDVDDLVDGYFEDARAKADSRVAWFTKGTIENPWTDDSQTVGINMPLYRTSYKRILVCFKELASYAISDTNNKVIFEVTPGGVFNFWRDRDDLNQEHQFSFPYGQVRSYRRIRRPILRRSHLIGVGASPTAVLLQTTQTNGLDNVIGRSEEPILLGYVKGQDELERVIKSRAKRAGRVDSDFYMSFYSNSIVPYRAGIGETYKIGQDIQVNLDRGTSWQNSETKLIAGQQVIYHRMAENVRLLLTDAL